MMDVTESSARAFRREILLTASLRHANIVNFVGACWTKDLTCLILEWVPRGSLGDMLDDSGLDLTWNDPMLQLARDIASAMNYLHSREFEDGTAGEEGSRRTSVKGSIIHRDLKPGLSRASFFH
jgi:serine/threonine protein kinase